MKNDVVNGNGDFATVTPRIHAEKENLIEELKLIDKEEDGLIRKLEDL